MPYWWRLPTQRARSNGHTWRGAARSGRRQRKMRPPFHLSTALPTPMSFDSPRLIADIGTSYARFALETAPATFERRATLRCADHADFQAMVQAYLSGLPEPQVEHAAVAMAYPVQGDQVRMTNSPWVFSIEQARQQLGLDTLLVVNDFTALAMSLPQLGPDGARQVGGGQGRPNSVIGLLGSGSGLGVSGLVPTTDGWVSLATEGGHSSFSPRDEAEIAVLRYAWRDHPHLSFERLLSGPGLALIYRALAEHAGRPSAALLAPDITRRALAHERDPSAADADPVAAQTLAMFCAMLGTAAANLAVTLGAVGGIYIGGGIVPRLGSNFDRSPFRARFEDKGRFSRYLAAIATRVITDEQATLVGTSAILASQLQARRAVPGASILGQIRRARGTLSPAEQRVADQVLSQARTVMNLPIAEIARAAGVSQPTVIRFCRSLGCQGLSDFKLRLASGLTGTLPISHVQVTGHDSMLELGAKVLDNTASAILQLRGQLNQAMVDRATDALVAAQRVAFFVLGQTSAVAQDAAVKFLRLGLPSIACTDTTLQALEAAVMAGGDVAVIISSGGRVPELLALADQLQQRKVTVVAITAGQSPLARKAQTVLAVDHLEDAATQLPMVSRILHLLVVDILAVGVAMRRPPAAAAETPLAAMSPHSR